MKIIEKTSEFRDIEFERWIDKWALLKLREKEFCLRFRAILENSDNIDSDNLDKYWEWDWQSVHINSYFARIRNYPKDVLANFVREKTSFATTF